MPLFLHGSPGDLTAVGAWFTPSLLRYAQGSVEMWRNYCNGHTRNFPTENWVLVDFPGEQRNQMEILLRKSGGLNDKSKNTSLSHPHFKYTNVT